MKELRQKRSMKRVRTCDTLPDHQPRLPLSEKPAPTYTGDSQAAIAFGMAEDDNDHGDADNEIPEYGDHEHAYGECEEESAR